MPSREEPPEPAAANDAAVPVATDPAALKDAAAAAAEAPQQGAEASTPADGGGTKSPSPAVSPSAVKERQIPVDPASLRRLGMVADEDSPLSAPSVFTELVVQSPLLPPLRRPTFVGASLSCSAASSPVHAAGPGTGAVKWDEAATPSPTSALRSLARQHSAALARLVAAPAVALPPTLPRCASRAEGRTMAPHDDEPVDARTLVADDGFTCGALCLLIPGFSRRKPAAAGAAAPSLRRQPSGVRPRRSSASRVASLERFECGSWSPPPPPAVAPHDAAADCHAIEVAAKTSWSDDADAPVKMAFVFDGEPPTRGILKKSASAARPDSARPSISSSQRHVRFSTATAVSCPSSPSASGAITPRLARARAEFNAYLEAQI